MIVHNGKYKYLIRAVMFLTFSIVCSVVFAKYSPIKELEESGFYGRVHAWGGVSRKFHNTELTIPDGAPVIISDYHSTVGSNGLGRSGKHRGVDIFEEVGSPIIAAADGIVVRAKVDKCWGPTLLIKHGKDRQGRTFYALYGHVKNFAVKKGQKVKRGQKIAEMGNDIFTSCGAGFHHLHFQISYNPRKVPVLGWGWANFVRDGFNAPNPHDYWEDGKGKITCFEQGRKYSASGLTYPVPCKNIPQERQNDSSVFADMSSDDSLIEIMVEASRALQQEEAAEAQAAAEGESVTQISLDAQYVEIIDDQEMILDSQEQTEDDVIVLDEEWEDKDIDQSISEYVDSDESTEEPSDLERGFISSGLRYLDRTSSQSAEGFLDEFFE